MSHDDWQSRAKSVLAEARAARARGASSEELETILGTVRSTREDYVPYALALAAREEPAPRRIPSLAPRGTGRHCHASKLSPRYARVDCRGSGWLLNEDDEATPCPCRRLAAINPAGELKRFFAGNVTLSLDSPPLTGLGSDARAAAVQFIEALRGGEQLPSLWFADPDPHAFRTTLAAYLAERATRANRSVSFLPLRELVGRLSRLAAERDASEPSLVAELDSGVGRVDLLIIDDVDGSAYTESRSAAAQSFGKRTLPPGDPTGRQLDDRGVDLLALVLDERWANQRATIVTSRLSADQLEASLNQTPKRDLLFELIECARDGESNHSRIEAWRQARARRFVSRLSGLCGEPIPLRDTAKEPSAAAGFLGV